MFLKLVVIVPPVVVSTPLGIAVNDIKLEGIVKVKKYLCQSVSETVHIAFVEDKV